MDVDKLQGRLGLVLVLTADRCLEMLNDCPYKMNPASPGPDNQDAKALPMKADRFYLPIAANYSQMLHSDFMTW